MISTVNFHLTSKCNYQCKYCFAHFCEVESQLNVDDRKKLVKALCAPKWVDKINFVGGEPTLIGDQLIDLMVNPEGCFFDNTQGGYTVSAPILEVGIENALQQVHFDVEKFNQRGGKYAIPNA